MFAVFVVEMVIAAHLPVRMEEHVLAMAYVAVWEVITEAIALNLVALSLA